MSYKLYVVEQIRLTLISAARSEFVKQNKQLSWPIGFSERFHLFALGKSFDVDAFVESSSLKPDLVWRRKRSGQSNGIELVLGDAETLNLSEQEEIAISYLRNRRDELRALAQFRGIEAFNLGLQCFPTGPATALCVGPSARLMYHCLDVGVTPNYYVSFRKLKIIRGPSVVKL